MQASEGSPKVLEVRGVQNHHDTYQGSSTNHSPLDAGLPNGMMHTGTGISPLGTFANGIKGIQTGTRVQKLSNSFGANIQSDLPSILQGQDESSIGRDSLNI